MAGEQVRSGSSGPKMPFKYPSGDTDQTDGAMILESIEMSGLEIP